METPNLPAIRARRPAWKTGRIVGQKHPLKPNHVWAITVRLELSENHRGSGQLFEWWSFQGRPSSWCRFLVSCWRQTGSRQLAMLPICYCDDYQIRRLSIASRNRTSAKPSRLSSVRGQGHRKLNRPCLERFRHLDSFIGLVFHYVLHLTTKTLRQCFGCRWRRVPESNRSTRICNPLHNLPAHSPLAARYTKAKDCASHTTGRSTVAAAILLWHDNANN